MLMYLRIVLCTPSIYKYLENNTLGRLGSPSSHPSTREVNRACVVWQNTALFSTHLYIPLQLNI